MTEHEPTTRQPARRRGLESVVKLYISRRRADNGADGAIGAESAAVDPLERERRAAAERLADLPPHDPADDAAEPGEETLPPLRLGSEAARAEAAFRLEEALLLEWSEADEIESARDPEPAPESRKPDADYPDSTKIISVRPEDRGAGAEAANKEEPLTPDGDSTSLQPMVASPPAPEPIAAANEGQQTHGARATGIPEGPFVMKRSVFQSLASEDSGPDDGTTSKPPFSGLAAEISEAEGGWEPTDEIEIAIAPDGADESREAGAIDPEGSATQEARQASMEAPPAAAPTSIQPQPIRTIPRTVLLIGATPLRLRRLLLEALAAPAAAEGRGVLLLESALPLDDASAMLDLALDRGSPILRRNLGVRARDLLLSSPGERRALFDGLIADEQRSDLVIVDLELPESILAPRLQFLVDDVVVALTSNETSLYEAYRALRGIAERRPEMTIHAVPAGRSLEEARALLERFRAIAKEFLRMAVDDGGWLSMPESPAQGEAPEIRLSAGLTSMLRRRPERGPARRAYLGDPDRSFFEHLSSWFGPSLES